MSSNIYRGASETRPAVDRIVPYQRDSNSSGSRRGLDVGPLFSGKDIESDSNQIPNYQGQVLGGSGRLPHIEDDQQRAIARSGDYEIQSRKIINQPMIDSNTTNLETRVMNREISNQGSNFNHEGLSHRIETEKTERSNRNEGS